PREQLMEVVGPGLVFRAFAADGDIGQPAIAPVMDEHAVAGFRHALAERLDQLERPPSAWGKRHPRTMGAEHLVIEIDPADIRNRHSALLSCNLALATMIARNAPGATMVVGFRCTAKGLTQGRGTANASGQDAA